MQWRDVEPLIHDAFGRLADVDVLVFPPGETPRAADMPSRGPTPAMTPGRAALIALMTGYAVHALDAPSLIESQKLMYFLQAAGEPLRLNFVKHRYGPYADNLRHVLQVLEGHYLSGFGDGSAPVQEAEPLTVLPGAEGAAVSVLDEHPETQHRIDRVLTLADGFESAYGMELLASVHWIVHEDADAASDPERAERGIQAWTARKGRLFTTAHVHTAWCALRDRGWLPERAVVGSPA